LLGLFALSMAFPSRPQNTAALKLESSIPLQGFTGDFDHFAIDEKDGRVFLAGEDHKTLEVFDVNTNLRLKLVGGVCASHAIFYLRESDQILIADGDKGVVRILSGKDYSDVAQVPGLAGADSARLDAAAHTLYIVAGGKDVPLDHSFIVAIDLQKNAKVR